MPLEDKETKLVITGIDGLPLDLSDTSNATVWAMKRVEALYALTLERKEDRIDAQIEEITYLKKEINDFDVVKQTKNATISNYMADKDKDLATIKNNLIQIKRLKNRVKWLEDEIETYKKERTGK